MNTINDSHPDPRWVVACLEGYLFALDGAIGAADRGELTVRWVAEERERTLVVLEGARQEVARADMQRDADESGAKQEAADARIEAAAARALAERHREGLERISELVHAAQALADAVSRYAPAYPQLHRLATRLGDAWHRYRQAARRAGLEDMGGERG